MEWTGLASLWLPPAAFVLDCLVPDPRWLPHPVQGIGWLLDRLEPLARRFAPGRFGGVVCLLVLFCVVGLVVRGGVALPLVGSLVALYAAWAGLAIGGLLRECRSAAAAIAAGEAEGRSAVSMLVSRDLSEARRPDLYRALAETLAENFNDAFVAPFFWLVLGGPVALWLYKAVSTVDSMWGYRTERWERLGWAGARLDDVLAWVPARLSALFLLGAAPLCGLQHDGRSLRALWRLVRRDARSMESPNAGWPMAAAAWLHARSMGGPTCYFGAIKEKPQLGPRLTGEKLTGEQGAEWDTRGIEALLHHVRLAAMLGAAVLWIAGLCFF